MVKFLKPGEPVSRSGYQAEEIKHKYLTLIPHVHLGMQSRVQVILSSELF